MLDRRAGAWLLTGMLSLMLMVSGCLERVPEDQAETPADTAFQDEGSDAV